MTPDSTTPHAGDRATHAAMALVVIYTDRLEECRGFYTALGVAFVEEQHSGGPVYYTATFPNGLVLELYRATATRPATGALRLGLVVPTEHLSPALDPGRHLRTDPDGRTVEIQAQRDSPEATHG